MMQVGDIMIHVGGYHDIMSTSGDVQHIEVSI